jgi:hypothetical protein
LTEAQVIALEKAKEERKAHGEIETHHPGYLGAPDTYYMGNIQGWGIFISNPILIPMLKLPLRSCMTVKMRSLRQKCLNDKVVPFYEQHDLRLLRILTDRRYRVLRCKGGATRVSIVPGH